MKKAISYFTLLICLCSCHPYYYYPSYQEVPIQTEKNQLNATGSVPVIADPDGNIGALSASYTLTDHIGIMTAYNHHSRSTNRLDYDNDTTGGKDSYMVDVGAFYYGTNGHSFGKRGNLNLTHAVTAAYSFGKQQEYSEYFTVSMDRIYLQPSIALTSKYFDIGFSVRMSYINFGLDNNTMYQFDRQDYNLNQMEDHAFYFMEPQLFVQGGYKWAKLGFYLNNAFNLSEYELEYDEGTFGIMLQLQLSGMYQDIFQRNNNN